MLESSENLSSATMLAVGYLFGQLPLGNRIQLAMKWREEFQLYEQKIRKLRGRRVATALDSKVHYGSAAKNQSYA